MKHLIVAFLVLTGLVTAADYPAEGTNGRVYNSPAGFSIEVPQGWEYGTGLMGADLFAIAPPSSEHGTANFNVMIGDSGGLTLTKFYETSLAGLQAIVEGLKMDQSGDSKLGSMAAKWHVYTYPHGEIKLKVLQYVAIDGPLVYVLTFTTAAPDYSYYKPIFKEVVDSFDMEKASAAPRGKRAPAQMGFEAGINSLFAQAS